MPSLYSILPMKYTYLLILPVVVALLVVVTRHHNLPSLAGRSQSHALTSQEASATALGRALTPQTESHPGQSGITPLTDAQASFAARILLARAAQRTLDVQYYIWRNDLTGTLLLNALYQAAQRGVRVRLLLDDNGTSGMDEKLALLDAHPNIEVRLFNPFVIRSPKMIGYLVDFSRLNRRMHNKSFTADNQVSIVGGRNIGDEYFGATDGVLFSDLDVVGVGAVVPDVSRDFDRYWASQSAYPLDGLMPAKKAEDLQKLNQAGKQAEMNPKAAKFMAAISHSQLVRDIVNNQLGWHWSQVAMISDDPAKGLGQVKDEDLMLSRLSKVLDAARQRLDLVSPYFVPTTAGVKALSALAARGVKVRVLTNALEATDVTAVHAGYAKRRQALLKAGIQLFEMQYRGNGEDTPENQAGPFGSSGSSLHAKTFSVDGKKLFVGSFNFDPRSASLNTEMGFVIDTAMIAQQIQAAFDHKIPANAYEVRLDPSGHLYWLELRGGRVVKHTSEPNASWPTRLWVALLERLPIEWLL